MEEKKPRKSRSNKSKKSTGDALISQVTRIKATAVHMLTYQKNRLTVVENKTIMGIYELMDDILLNNIHSPRYTMEEYVDAKLVEYGVLLGKTKNTMVKELFREIDGGIKW